MVDLTFSTVSENIKSAEVLPKVTKDFTAPYIHCRYLQRSNSRILNRNHKDLKAMKIF
jgi:hypothetical protein